MGKFFKGLFRVFSLIQKTILGLLFWGVLVLIVIGIFYNRTPKVREGEVLVLAPEGYIVEEYSTTALERDLDSYMGKPPAECLIGDLKWVLERAANDRRIPSVLLDLSGYYGAGPAVLEELRRSLDAYRNSGKPLYAYAPFLDRGGLSLASLCDEIIVDPMGEIFIQGYGTYRAYMKEGLDKWGVTPHIYRAGENKDYVTPYMENGMTGRERAAAASYLDDLWDSWLRETSSRLDISPEDLQYYCDNYGTLLSSRGITPAELALDNHLADGMMSYDDFNQLMISRVGLDDSGSGFSQTYWRDYRDREFTLPVTVPGSRVALLVLSGDIVWGEGEYSQMGSYQVEQALDMILSDPSTAALVIRLDSPGGSAMGAEIIRRKLEKFHNYGIPLFVSLGNTGASGGYWIACEADEIWAENTTLTGSIGVFSYFFTVQDLLKEKFGVNVDGYGTTALSDAYRIDRDTSSEEDRMLQAGVDQTYRQFLSLVSERRGIALEKLRPLAEGRVWTGRQALERGLVDGIGGLDQVLARAADAAGLGADFQVTAYDDNQFTTYQGLEGIIPAVKSALVSALLPDENPYGDPRHINARSNL